MLKSPRNLLPPIFLPWLVCAAAFFTACGGGRGNVSAAGLNLLVITLDTARADRIGVYGHDEAETPNIDALAAKGIRFADCRTPVPLTLPAHSTLFTGRYPLGHKVRDNGTFFLGTDETTLAETMGEAGYDTFAVIASFVLTAKFGLNQGFAGFDDSLAAGELLRNFHSEIPADLVQAKFRRWFENRAEGRFFAWVHFYDPHAPYAPPEPYRRGREGLEDLYDGELAFTDVHVGGIIRDLEAAGVLEDTLIVVVGDHGEAFGEHEEFGHSVFCYEENLKVPLILYCPRLFPNPAVVEDRVNLVDVMPTILELYGFETPAAVQGRSFAGMLSGKREKTARSFYIESMYGKESLDWAPLAGIIEGPYKLISLPEPELYDLDADPGEEANLFVKRTDVARALDGKLRDAVVRYTTAGAGAKRELSAEDRRRLQSLGYVSAFAGESGSAIDPKKGILLQNSYNLVNSDIEKGNLAAAEARIAKIAADNPAVRMPEHYELSAKIKEKRKDLPGVVAVWREAVEALPGNIQFKITLGGKLLQAGKLDEAEALGRGIVEMDGTSSGGMILLGSVAETRGDVEGASGYFEKALALEPNNVSLKVRLAKALVEAGRAERAFGLLRDILDDEIVTGDPGNVALLSEIGEALAGMDRLDEAFGVLAKALEMDPEDSGSWNGLGSVHYRKNDLEKARDAYEKALALDPENASAHNNLGALRLKRALAGKDSALLTRAIQAFDRALAIAPGMVSALNGRASAFSFGNRVPEAVRDWQKVLEIRPDFADAYFNLGITYLRAGDKTRALEILSRCKARLYGRLPPAEKSRLDRLIAEAGG